MEHQGKEMLKFKLDDGCEALLIVTEDECAKWLIDLPGGIQVTCPHGLSTGVRAQRILD